jgi:glycosyltransferase involved in cell wall biosynthesis
MTDPQPASILQLCEHFGGRDASLHGVARSFQWWLPAFDPTRFRVLLCSRKGRDRAAEEMERAGLRPLYLGYGKIDPRNLFALLRLLKRERIDLIHAHGYGACTWGRLAGRVRGIPVIVHERCNYRTVPLIQRPVERLLGPGTQTALAVSESSRQFCIHKRFMRPEAVRTLYNGILMEDLPIADPAWKESLRRERGLGPADPLLGVVGRLEPHKGLQDAFRALRLIRERQPSARLWVVGDGSYAEELHRLAEELGLRDAVDFLGFRRDARRVIQCFDVHLFPSHMEGTPNTLFEALGVGNAIAASRTDGQEEILVDGRHALMFDPGDVPAMADGVLRILEDPALEQSLRKEARALSKQFDGRQTIRAMETLYEEILASRRL